MSEAGIAASIDVMGLPLHIEELLPDPLVTEVPPPPIPGMAGVVLESFRISSEEFFAKRHESLDSLEESFDRVLESVPFFLDEKHKQGEGLENVIRIIADWEEKARREARFELKQIAKNRRDALAMPDQSTRFVMAKLADIHKGAVTRYLAILASALRKLDEEMHMVTVRASTPDSAMLARLLDDEGT